MKLKATLLLLSIALLAGCSSVYDAKAAMAKGGYQQVMTDTRVLEDFPERDRTLILNYRGHAKLGLGYLDSARADYLRAWNIMNMSQGGGVASAMMFSERQKFWMGDPYERAFNSWYAGVLLFEANKREDAIAAFKNAIFVDTGDLKENEYIADWVPAFIMRMRCYMDRGSAEHYRVQQLMDEVNKLPRDPANFDPNCPWLTLEAQLEANTLLWIELGNGPFFTAEGHHGSVRGINQSEYRESYARVFIDGQDMGQAFKMGDTYFQAITRGGRVMDDILKGKAIAKTASIAVGASAMHVGRKIAESGAASGDNATRNAGLITAGVGAAVMIGGLLMNAEADTRGNVLLPGETHLLMAKLPPGRHEVEVHFFDMQQRELRELRQTGIPIDVPETGDAVKLVRSTPQYNVRDTALKAADPYKGIKQ